MFIIDFTAFQRFGFRMRYNTGLIDDVRNAIVWHQGNAMECARGYLRSKNFMERPGMREAKRMMATTHISIATLFSRCNIADIWCAPTASPIWRLWWRMMNSILMRLSMGTTIHHTPKQSCAMYPAREGKINLTRSVNSSQLMLLRMEVLIAPEKYKLVFIKL